MNEEVKAWVAKAEADYRVATRELDVADEGALDAVCFHAQQCIEKLLKALLVARSVDPPRTHNLLELSMLVQASYPQWHADRYDLRFLTRGGVAFRYPGESATRAHAAKAITICERCRRDLLALVHTQQ
jgi:HEPN domain-containing protein